MFTFIDLFAGIGGFHIAMSHLGGKCVFASEIDENCRKTYIANFINGDENILSLDDFAGDITKVDPSTIPDHDILCAGFPCQPFSQAGLHNGFNDSRGLLIFDVLNIVKAKKPKVIFLENVRGLLSHDNSETFNVIKNAIESIGYSFYFKVIKASDFDCPQNRPRLYIICFRNDIDDTNFSFPEPIPLKKDMSWVFAGATVNKKIGYTLRVGGKHSPIDDRRNWDGYLVNGEVKRLTPKEGKRMQGFPDDYNFPVSSSVAMKQLGNSVAIPVIESIGCCILKTIKRANIN